MLSTTFLLLAVVVSTMASPMWPHYTVGQEHFEVIRMRSSTPLNPAAVYDVKCMDSNEHIVFHDENVAQLSICGGISGSVRKCNGSPYDTVGQSGSAKFMLTPEVKRATINISKERWEQCVRAARAVCPTGTMTGMCRGGASSGDLSFSLLRSPHD
ncbi:hypothetical protein BX600DRAFT_177901 [Xylariales sp. PMI_506]|nr:hypothetical protein BX600DRAFT_177901 [Xylariales sp. PMI_506]